MKDRQSVEKIRYFRNWFTYPSKNNKYLFIYLWRKWRDENFVCAEIKNLWEKRWSFSEHMALFTKQFFVVMFYRMDFRWTRANINEMVGIKLGVSTIQTSQIWQVLTEPLLAFLSNVKVSILTFLFHKKNFR